MRWEDVFDLTIGVHSKHDVSNYNGMKHISFASSKMLVIKSTIFPHNDIKNKGKSPDGKTVDQINYALVDD